MGIFSSLLGNAETANPEELNKEYSNILTDGEAIDIGFRLLRDVFVFTNERLIHAREAE